MASKKTAPKKAPQYVVIWTKTRPWFIAAGELVSKKGDEVVLAKARVCVFYRDTKGILGLASMGPGPMCRISGPADEATIGNVEAVVPCTDAARARWEAAPWQ